MTVFLCVVGQIIFGLHLINAAIVPLTHFENQIVRVKRFDEDMMAAGVQAAAGLFTSAMDVAGKGGAAKDSRSIQGGIPGMANFKTSHDTEVAVLDASGGGDDRRRKRSPCGRKNNGIPTTTIEPPTDDAAERKKRQTINDPDNVRPNFDGNDRTAIEKFVDSFVELAKKISNLFVPSDSENPQMRQQEMDDRY